MSTETTSTAISPVEPVQTVEAYRAKFGQRSMPLPSGIEFVLRRVGLANLVAMQILPQDLTSLALKLAGFKEAEDAQDTESDTDTAQATTERNAKAARLMQYVVAAACVSPSVSLDQSNDPGVLSIDEIDETDQGFIFAYALRGEAGATIPTTSGGEVKVEGLRNFRQGGRRAASTSTRQNGKGLRASAVGTDRA